MYKLYGVKRIAAKTQAPSSTPKHISAYASIHHLHSTLTHPLYSSSSLCFHSIPYRFYGNEPSSQRRQRRRHRLESAAAELGLTTKSTTDDRPRAKHVLPTQIALRQMAGEVTKSTRHENETADERAVRLRQEEMVAKAAGIEAARLLRERIEVSQALPQGSFPTPQQQRQHQQQSSNQAQPSTSTSSGSLKSSISYKSKTSPFKKFDPFFDYDHALEEAATLHPPKVNEDTSKKTNKPNGSSHSSNQSSYPSQSYSTPSSHPPPPPSSSALDDHEAVLRAMSIGSHGLSMNSSSSKVPFAPIPTKALRAAKVLKAREETLQATKHTLSNVKKTAIEAAQAELKRLDQQFDDNDMGANADAGARLEFDPSLPIDAIPPSRRPTRSHGSNNMKILVDHPNSDDIVNDSESSSTSTSHSTSRRGPSSPVATLKANKHRLEESKFQQPQQVKQQPPHAAHGNANQSTSKKNKKSKNAQSQSQSSKSRPPIRPGPDGKIPLQSGGGGSIRRPDVVPWQPGLYVKQFLLKIHPDLYHGGGDMDPTGNGDEFVKVGDLSEHEERTCGETMVRVNQDTVAKFNAIVDYYKIVK